MDRKFLDDRLRELDLYSEYYHRLELKTLAAALQYDDKLNCILTGYWEGNRRLVAITDTKILVITSGAMTQTQFVVIKRTAVTSWKFTRKFLLSTAEIVADGKTYVFAQTQGKREKLFNWAMEQPIRKFEE